MGRKSCNSQFGHTRKSPQRCCQQKYHPYEGYEPRSRTNPRQNQVSGNMQYSYNHPHYTQDFENQYQRRVMVNRSYESMQDQEHQVRKQSRLTREEINQVCHYNDQQRFSKCSQLQHETPRHCDAFKANQDTEATKLNRILKQLADSKEVKSVGVEALKQILSTVNVGTSTESSRAENPQLREIIYREARNVSAIEKLYYGKQCLNCGWRVTGNADAFRAHMDEHYQQNKATKEGKIKMTNHRQFYPTVKAWVGNEKIISKKEVVKIEIPKIKKENRAVLPVVDIDESTNNIGEVSDVFV